MKTIYYKKTMYDEYEALTNQKYFSNFNWFNFEENEVVWLEDNDEIPTGAAIIIRITDSAIWLKGISMKLAMEISS